MTDHAELRRVAEAATPGPWEYQAPLKVLAADRTWIVLIALSHANCREDKANSRFIAANNPKTVLALLDEIDRLKAENDAFRSALKPFADYCTATDGKGIRLAIGGSCGDTEIDRTEWKAAQAALEGATK
ncbi:TPA: ead/Ea22-like family protein [Pseudomonas aeruginosa]